MSSISVQYKKDKTTKYIEARDIDSPRSTVYDIAAKNQLPIGLTVRLGQSPAYRDLFIAECLSDNLSIEHKLNVLGTLCRYITDVYKVKKTSDIAVCETIMTLAYIYSGMFGGNGDDFNYLVEQTLLRVPYTLATTYIKTLYEEIIINKSISSKQMHDLFIDNKGDVYKTYLSEDKIYSTT